MCMCTCIEGVYEAGGASAALSSNTYRPNGLTSRTVKLIRKMRASVIRWFSRKRVVTQNAILRRSLEFNVL